MFEDLEDAVDLCYFLSIIIIFTVAACCIATKSSPSPPSFSPLRPAVSVIIYLSMMSSTLQFSPAVPMPLQFDVRERIRELRQCLDPYDPWYQPEGQHDNIKTVIKLHEAGAIGPSDFVYVSEGKVITKEQYQAATTWRFAEVC